MFAEKILIVLQKLLPNWHFMLIKKLLIQKKIHGATRAGNVIRRRLVGNRIVPDLLQT